MWTVHSFYYEYFRCACFGIFAHNQQIGSLSFRTKIRVENEFLNFASSVNWTNLDSVVYFVSQKPISSNIDALAPSFALRECSKYV